MRGELKRDSDASARSERSEPRSREQTKRVAVNSIVPILLLGLAGMLVGGAVSMHRQGARRATVVAVGLLAALATAAGVLWLLPES